MLITKDITQNSSETGLTSDDYKQTSYEVKELDRKIEELEERHVIIQEELVWISIYDENRDENGQLKQYEDIINE